MLPRDFGEKKDDGDDLYPRKNRVTYESRVLDYLEKLPQGTPVQIAISKWDLNGELEPKGAGEAEVLSSPVFKTCYERVLNSYRSRNGKDYDAGILAISTKQLSSDGTTWIDSEMERESKEFTEAHNVRELFRKMSYAADRARTERLVEDWEKAKWWNRWFIMPWRSLGVFRKNSSDETIKSICNKALLRFGSFLAAALITICASIITWSAVGESLRLSAIEKTITSQKNNLPSLTTNELAMTDMQLNEPKWIHSLFFNSRLENIKGDQFDLKTSYVHFLENDLKEKLNAPRVVERSPWEVSPAERASRATGRLDIVKEQLARIPEGMSSEYIRSNEAAIGVFIKNLNRDKDFDQALYDLRGVEEEKKLREMDNVRNKFSNMVNVRTNDFKRLENEICALEDQLDKSLQSKIADIEKKNLSNDWQGNVKRAEEKVMAIRYSIDNVFILGSEKATSWENRIKEIEKQIAHDKHYGPFDVDYAALNREPRDQKLKAIANFRAKYPTESYAERGKAYESLAAEEKKLIEEIRSGVAPIDKEMADDAKLPMRLRIERAEKRIGGYEFAKAKLRNGDNDYSQLAQKIEGTKKWISDHEKYIGFENQWKVVESTSETNRVHAIKAFLGNHTKEEYPEYADRLLAVEKMAKELSTYFVKKCKEIHAASAKCTGSWETKIAASNERIRAIEAMRSSVLITDQPELSKLIDEEKADIAKLKHDGLFSDELNKTLGQPDDRVLGAIMRFRDTFKEDDYQGRKNDYGKLYARETNVLAKIGATLKNEIEIPKVVSTNFVGRQMRSRDIRLAYERALESIPSNHVIAATYRRGRATAADDEQKYAIWVKIREDAERLAKAAIGIEEKDGDEKLQVQKQVIKLVGAFFSHYPMEKFVDGELANIYKNVKDILEDAETELYRKFQEEYNKFPETSARDDRDRIANKQQRLKLIDECLGDFWECSDRRTALVKLREDVMQTLDDEQIALKFKEDYRNLQHIIKDKKQVSEKIVAINVFLSVYSSHKYQRFPMVAETIKLVNTEKHELETQQAFEELVAEKVRLVAGKPNDVGDGSLLKEYKRKCLELKKKVEAYKQAVRIEGNVKKCLKELEEEITWVESKMGDGSWSDIKTKEDEYKQHPTKENYDALMNAITTFDEDQPGNAAYSPKVKDAKAAAEKDWNLAQDVNRTKTDFLDNPNGQMFSSFIGALGRFTQNKYREENDTSKDYSNFYDLVSKRNFSLDWEWQGFDFKDTNLEHWTDYWLELSFCNRIDDKYNTVCEVSDIQNDNWRPSEGCKLHQGKLKGHCSIIENVGLKIKLKHVASPQKDNYLSASWYEMLAWGIEDHGASTRRFRIRGNGESTKDAAIYFRFSGLPFLPEGDL